MATVVTGLVGPAVVEHGVPVTHDVESKVPFPTSQATPPFAAAVDITNVLREAPLPQVASQAPQSP